MRLAIATWLLSTAASASITLGPPAFFADPPVGTHSVVGLVPREDGVAAFYRGTADNTLYEERLGQSAAKTVLTGVDAALISNGFVAFQAAGSIFTAPLLPDDSVDVAQTTKVAEGSLVAFGCNDSRCLAQWKEGAASYRAQIVGGSPVTLERPASVLAVDPDGFLVSVSGALRRVANDGVVTPVETPALLGIVNAADFDGTRYTLVGQADRTIAAAAMDLGGAVGSPVLLVDQRPFAGGLHIAPYRSYGVQIAWSGTQHLVVAYWSNDFVVSNSFAWPVYAEAYLLTADLQITRDSGLGGTSAAPAAIAFGQDRFWVLWYDLPLVTWSVPPGRLAFLAGATLATNGTSARIERLPVMTSRSAPLVAVAASEGRVVGVWSEQVQLANRYVVRALAKGDAAPIVIGDSATLSAAVANVGDTFLVTMQRDDGIGGVVRANGAWTPLDLGALGKGGNVAVAANDAAFLVATADRGRLVAVEVGDGVSGRIDLAASDAPSPVAAASDGDGFALLSTRNGSTLATVIDAVGNFIASREIGPAATSLAICWSGSDYVAIGTMGMTARTWRLSRYGDVVLSFDTPRDAQPLSIARAGEGVVATWSSSKGSFLTALPPRQSAWSDPRSVAPSAAVSRGGDALLFGWDYGGLPWPILATRTLHYETTEPRRRAVR